jgi:hypothetical protein
MILFGVSEPSCFARLYGVERHVDARPYLNPVRRSTADVARHAHEITAARPLPTASKRGYRLAGSDIDADAGVAAIWLARRAGWPIAVNGVCQFERVGNSWQCVSGGGTGEKLPLAGRPSASRSGPASMMTHVSSGAGRSRADREALGLQQDPAKMGWVAYETFRVAAEVAHLQVGARRIKVPQHGYVIVAWKAPPSYVSPPRPPIAAVSDDGLRLTELGPNDHLDSLTWASLQGD